MYYLEIKTLYWTMEQRFNSYPELFSKLKEIVANYDVISIKYKGEF